MAHFRFTPLRAGRLLALAALAVAVPVGGSHTALAQGSKSLLPNSPLSGGLLMAQAIHSGRVHLPASRTGVSSPGPNLTCSPAPCALPNVVASPSGQPANEVPIVVDPSNSMRLLSGANDYNCADLQGFYGSTDGGSTWNHTCMPNGGAGCGDPGVGVDTTGTYFATGLRCNKSPQDSTIMKSTNGGMTWSTPNVAVQCVVAGCLVDKDWLQIDTGATSPRKDALYISTTQFGTGLNSSIVVSHSTDHGATFKNVLVDSQTGSVIDQFSDLAIDPKGNLYVSWLQCPPTGPTSDCGGTVSKLLMSKSTDGGVTWSKIVTIATVNLAPDSCGAFYGCLPGTSERISDIPSIAVDPAKSTHLSAVFYSYTGAYMQVESASSNNSGGTWGAPVPVAPKTDKHDQFFAWGNYNNKGLYGVTYMDRGPDPANHKYTATGTASLNGGTSFVTPLAIASAPSDPNNDGFGGGFFGDYDGNFWTPDSHTLYASWTDTRSGTAVDEVGGGRAS